MSVPRAEDTPLPGQKQVVLHGCNWTSSSSIGRSFHTPRGTATFMGRKQDPPHAPCTRTGPATGINPCLKPNCKATPRWSEQPLRAVNMKPPTKASKSKNISQKPRLLVGLGDGKVDIHLKFAAHQLNLPNSGCPAGDP